jgi:hypothetical protein
MNVKYERRKKNGEWNWKKKKNSKTIKKNINQKNKDQTW